jgi:predicted O-methyltransferase YrrM
MDETERLDRLEKLKSTARCGDNPPFAPLDSVEGLLDMIAVAKPRVVLELGSDRGVSTEAFLLTCERVVAVDPWVDDIGIAHPERYDAFIARCGSYPHLLVVRGRSPGDLSLFADEVFDLVYIDAVHTYDGVMADVAASRRLIKPSGWFAGHDYRPESNSHDIIPAVNELFGADNIQTFADGSWLVRKSP